MVQQIDPEVNRTLLPAVDVALLSVWDISVLVFYRKKLVTRKDALRFTQ